MGRDLWGRLTSGIPTINELTGEQAARDKEEKIGEASGQKNAALEKYRQEMLKAQQAQAPWFQRALQEYQTLFQRGENALLQGQDQASGYLTQGLQGGLGALGIGLQGGLNQLTQGGQNATIAELLRYTQDLANTREGMDLDTKSLTALLTRALDAQSPYIQASQQALGVLPGMMGAMGYGGAGLPQSLGAAIQMEDANKITQNAMQRQGLSGSGMEMAQQAAARRRILAEDQQSQWNKANDLLKTGMAGAQLGSGTISSFAPMLGNIGNRLGQVKGMDLASTFADIGRTGAGLFQNYGQGGADLYRNYGTSQADMAGKYAEALSRYYQSGKMPEWYSNTGTTAYNNIMNPAGLTLNQGLNAADATALIGNVQHPTLLDTAGKVADIGSTIFGSGSTGQSLADDFAKTLKRYFGG